MTRRSLLASAACGALAQQKQEDPVFSSGIRVVNILATVRDQESGRLVTTLDKDDFALDDERVPQTIRYFTRESDLPLTIGLVVDTSGSQLRLLPAEREAAAVFAERVVREGQDRVFVLKFDRYVSLVQDLTGSKERVKRSLARLQPSPKPASHAMTMDSIHTSRLFDAIQTGCERYFGGPGLGRRALIVLSDGADSGLPGAIHRAIEAAIRAEAVVFSICYRDPRASNPAMLPEDPVRPRGGTRNLPSGPGMAGRGNMLMLALETGGSFFDVDADTPIGQVFRLVEEELRSQYSIGFTPEGSGPGRFHRVRLKTKRPGYEIRYRSGYYAEAR